MPARHATIGALVKNAGDMALGAAGCSHPGITILLKNIGVYRLRFPGGSARLRVRVFVDNTPQARTEVQHSESNFTWHFPSPVKLLAHASSVIKFCVYREHRALAQVRDDEIVGQFEGRLVSFLNSATQYRIASKSCPNSTLSVTLDVDYGATLQNPVLEFALQQVQGLWENNTLQSCANAASPHLSMIGQVIQHIDKVLDLLDGMAELQAFCKMAWVLFLSIYDSVKTQVKLDADLRSLVCELRDSLALIRVLNGASKMPRADTTIQAVILLVIEAASLIDEWVHMKTLKKAVQASTFDRRIRGCTERLSGLRSLMTVFAGAEYLVRNIMAEVGQIREETRRDTEGVKQLLERLQPFAVQQIGRESHLPAPVQTDISAPLAEAQELVPTHSAPEQSCSSAEPAAVERTPSQGSQDSQDSRNTQSTALPPYTSQSEQPPPFYFAPDATVALCLDGPFTEEPINCSLPPLESPEDKGKPAFEDDAHVMIIFDPIPLPDTRQVSPLSQPQPLPLPASHTEYADGKKTERMTAAPKYWWQRHHGSTRAATPVI